MFWILKFWWICHALLLHHLVLFSCLRDESEVVNVLNSISAVYDYIIIGDKATLINPCSPCPYGALEKVEALASSYGIRLNSIGRYGKWRWFCIDTLVLLESATRPYPLLRSKVENSLAGQWRIQHRAYPAYAPPPYWWKYCIFMHFLE